MVIVSKDMIIPEKLKSFAKKANAEDWLNALPSKVNELAELWGLELQDAYPNCGVAYVVPAKQMGETVVLKVQWPHEECRYEVDALKLWDGDGAVNLLESNQKHHAMLLEHCDPGTHLSNNDADDPIGVMIDLLPRLWKRTDGPFKRLRQEARDWQCSLYSEWEASGRACERSLIDAAYGIMNELSDSQGEQVLVHQDLHGDNVLASSRDGWLAIDPKPLIGEREFALSPIIRSFEFGETKKDVIYRLDRLTSELSLNRERARGWAIAQSIAWGLGGDYSAKHQQTARWLLSAK